MKEGPLLAYKPKGSSAGRRSNNTDSLNWMLAKLKPSLVIREVKIQPIVIDAPASHLSPSFTNTVSNDSYRS
mgnify:CR=1 FL=1